MKENILEILHIRISAYQMVNDDDPIEITGEDVAAEEITAMVMEFVEWAFTNCTQWVVDMTEIRYSIYGEGIYSTVDYSLEELFNYWLTNIYKK